jgi:hypothetical protein
MLADFLDVHGVEAPASQQPFAIDVYGNQTRWTATHEAGLQILNEHGVGRVIVRAVQQAPDEFAAHNAEHAARIARRPLVGIHVGALWRTTVDNKVQYGQDERLVQPGKTFGHLAFGGEPGNEIGVTAFRLAEVLAYPTSYGAVPLRPEEIAYRRLGLRDRLRLRRSADVITDMRRM